jgi:hypothetical protein
MARYNVTYTATKSFDLEIPDDVQDKDLFASDAAAAHSFDTGEIELEPLGPPDPRPACPTCGMTIVKLGVVGPLMVSGRFFLNTDDSYLNGELVGRDRPHVQQDFLDWTGQLEGMPPVLECSHCGTALPEEIAAPLRKLF